MPRRDEDVARDTIMETVPAIDSGAKFAQFYCECLSLICDVYGITLKSQFVNTLEDTIQTREAPDRILSD